MGHDDTTRRILVAGGTGQTGRRVVHRLLDAGATVRVLARSADKARATLGDGVELHEGDARDPASLEGLAEGVSAAVLTMGTRTYFGANGGSAVDAVGTANLVAALSGRIDHVVLLSAFGLDRTSVFLSLFSAVLGSYFEHKAAAEAAVRGSGIPYTIVRPVELRNRPARGLPRLNQQDDLSLLRTVSRDAVADVLVACLGRTDVLSCTFEVCAGGTAPLADQLATLLPDPNRPRPRRTPLL